MSSSRRTIAIVALVLLGLAVEFLVLSVIESERRTWLLIRNTLLLSAGACAISLPIGTLVALFIVRTDMPGRAAFAVLFGMLLFTPLYLQAAAWDAGFGQLGWQTLTGESFTRPLLSGWRAAVWIHGMTAIPWVVLIVGVALRWVEPELEEEALLNASTWKVFTHVTLIRALAALAVAALWVFVTTAGEMTVTDLYRVRTYAEELYLGFPMGDDLGTASLSAASGMTLIAWLVVAAFVAASFIAPPDGTTWPRPPRKFRLGAWRWPALIAVLFVVLTVVGVPIVNLTYNAGVEVTTIGDERVRAWSPEKCWDIISTTPWRYRNDFAWTATAGVAAASCTVILAAGLAWWARRGRWASVPALFTTAVCLSIPGPLIGLGLITALNRPEVPFIARLYNDTILAPALAMIIRSLPLTILVAWYALRTISRDELDSAATEGAGPLALFWRIAAPQRIVALIMCWLIALALSVGDLAASILVVPPGLDLLSVRIFGLVHAGVDDRVAGLCLVTAAAFAILAACILLLWRFAHNRMEYRSKIGIMR